MDDKVCQLCRQINLYTLGAFYHNTKWAFPTTPSAGVNQGEENDDDPDSDSDSDSDDDLGHEVDDHCITRTRDQLSDDCLLCQLFLNPDSILSERDPPREVQLVTIKAQPFRRPEQARLLSELGSSLYDAGRFWLSRFGRVEYFPLSQIMLEIVYKGQEKVPMHAVLDVSVDEESTAEERRYIAGRPTRAIESDANLDMVAGWLRECTASHKLCRVGVSGRRFDDAGGDDGGTVLPDRVVRVGGGFHPYLVENMGKNRRGRYAALSYCWGPFDPENPPFRLLKGNRADLLERLPLSELPATIVDAIDFTRRLGIDYIWIDRLCILQDDDADWRAQAAKMCDVYEGATLTVAALAAASGDEGIYQPREPRPSVRVRCATQDQEVGHMRVARRLDPGPTAPLDLRSPYTSAFEQELGLGLWNKRGWTMQERLISRRVVYLGRWQLFWECQEAMRKEDGITDGSDSLGARKGGSKRDLSSRLGHYQLISLLSKIWSTLRRTEEDWSGRSAVWVDIIKDFTSRKLSFHGDKERAVAGVAEAVRLRLGFSDYAYGIFLDLADRLLLWHGKGPLTKSEDVLAPSWSWMVHDGEMTVIRDAFTSRLGARSFVDGATLRSTGFSSATSTPPDPVALKISGARVPMTWQFGTHPQQASQVTAWYEALSESLVLPPKLILESMLNNETGLMLLMDGKICGIVEFDLEDHRQPGLCCLIVGELADPKVWARKNSAAGQRRIYHLLVLEEIPSDASIPVYRRVGIAQAAWDGEIGFPLHEKALPGEIFII